MLTRAVVPVPTCVLCCGGSAGRSKVGGKEGDDDGDGFAVAGKKKGRNKKADPSLLGFSVESSRIMQGEIQHAE